MGLDIYAGTLTRYYCGNWKNMVQQWAEACGHEYHVIRPNDNQGDDEEPDEAEVQAAVEQWRNLLIESVMPPGSGADEQWPENNTAPYFTHKPDWDAFGALLVTAACARYGEPIPQSVEKNHDFMEHPLVLKAAEDTEKVWSLFRGATMWVPLSRPLLFNGTLVNGSECTISTLAALRLELEKLNSMVWQADEATVAGWKDTEGYPADLEQAEDGSVDPQKIQKHDSYDTQSLARYAFSILWEALLFAEKNRSAIIMDF